MRQLHLLTALCFAGMVLSAQVLPDCGGENQRACSPADKEFWETDSLACEYDLSLKTHVFHDDTCVDHQRRTLDKDYTWVGWALSEQRYNIAADLGINFSTHLGTHNSYSNTQQGYVDVVSYNQYYSITDQLQAGARTIRLDPWFYYDEMRLCHAEKVSQCEDTSAGRFYADAVREIGAWLDANPGEVIIIRIHDSNDLTDHKDYFNKPIETYLGSKVFTQTEKDNGYVGRWPTMRELRAANHQVIIFSSHDYGAGWSFKYGDYFKQGTLSLEGNRNAPLFATCSNPQTSPVPFRDFDKWALISEGRTMSDSADPLINFVFHNPTPGLLDEPQVTESAACSFSNIEVDFLLRLDKGYNDRYSNFGRSPGDLDLRREASIWSWQQDDYGRRGPALLDVPTGRWRSLAAANNYPYLCMKPDPTTYTGGVYNFGSPARGTWRATSFLGAWNLDNGNRECTAEFGAGYTFSFPRNALQNQQALAAVKGNAAVWLGFSAIPVPEPSAGPPIIRFTMQRGGAVPGPITVQVVGTVGDTPTTPNTFNAQFLSGADYFTFSIPSNVIQLKGTPLIVSVNPGAPQLAVGLYQAVIQLSEPSKSTPGGVISVALEVEEPTTTTISALPSNYELTQTVVTSSVQGHPLPAFQDSITGTVVLRETVTDPITSRTTVVDLAQAYLASPDVNTTGPENQVKFMVTLLPGVHSLIAHYLGDSHYGPSDSSLLTVTVKPLIRVQPSSISFSISKSAPVAGPWQVSAFDTVPPEVTSGFFTIPAANNSNAGRVPLFVSVSPVGASATSATITQDPGAFSALPPGQYDLDVQFARGDRVPAPEVCHLTMKVLGTLSPTTAQATLTADALTQSVSIGGSGSMPVNATVNQASWLSASLVSSTTPSTLVLTANPAGLAPGDYLATVSVTSPVSENSIAVTVKFHLLGATTVSTNLAGGTVVVDRQSFASPATFYWEPGSHHNVSVAVTQSPEPATRWRFQNWNDGLAMEHAVIVPSAIGPGLTLMATYTAEYQLSTSATPAGGGTFVATPSSPDGFYPAGAHISVNAKPTSGYLFLSFVGGLSGSVTPSTVVMNAPQSVGAIFTVVPPKSVDVQISTSPAGLTVNVDGTSQPAGLTYHWQVGSTHTITAAPVQGEQNGGRLAFTQWSDGGAASHSISAPDARSAVLTASYLPEYQLTVTAQPQNGGTVTGAAWYKQKAFANVTATAAQGFTFSGFSGALLGSANPQTLTINGPMQVQANFTAAPPNIYASPGLRGDAPGDTRTVVIALTNSGGPALNAQIDSITNIKIVTGSGDVHLTSSFPLVEKALAAGGSGNLLTVWKWPTTATRVQFTVNFSANSGSYRGSTVLTIFR